MIAGSISGGFGAGQKVKSEGGSAVDLGWTKGRDHVWLIEGSGLRVRSVIAQGCGGKATLTFMLVWADAPGKQLVDEWLASFKPSEDGVAPTCRKLGQPTS